MVADDENDENISVAYQACLIRWQTTNSVIWQLYAFLIAAQVALAVALAQTDDDTIRFAVGVLGMGSLGIAGPLAMRSMQGFLLMENYMLDQYERVLLPNRRLRLHHRKRFRQRLQAIREQLDEVDQKTLTSRQMTGLGRLGARVDNVLDIASQVANLWAAVVAGTGVFGIIAGLTFWNPTDTLGISAKVLVCSLPILVIAAQAIGSKVSSDNTERVSAYWDWFEQRANPNPPRRPRILRWVRLARVRIVRLLRRIRRRWR